MVVCTAAKASARKKVQKVQGPSATQELPPIAKSIVIGAKVRHACTFDHLFHRTHQHSRVLTAHVEESPCQQVQHHVPEEKLRLVV